MGAHPPHVRSSHHPATSALGPQPHRPAVAEQQVQPGKQIPPSASSSPDHSGNSGIPPCPPWKFWDSPGLHLKPTSQATQSSWRTSSTPKACPSPEITSECSCSDLSLGRPLTQQPSGTNPLSHPHRHSTLNNGMAKAEHTPHPPPKPESHSQPKS